MERFTLFAIIYAISCTLILESDSSNSIHAPMALAEAAIEAGTLRKPTMDQMVEPTNDAEIQFVFDYVTNQWHNAFVELKRRNAIAHSGMQWQFHRLNVKVLTLICNLDHHQPVAIRRHHLQLLDQHLAVLLALYNQCGWTKINVELSDMTEEEKDDAIEIRDSLIQLKSRVTEHQKRLKLMEHVDESYGQIEQFADLAISREFIIPFLQVFQSLYLIQFTNYNKCLGFTPTVGSSN